jgi:hypothetical protein
VYGDLPLDRGTDACGEIPVYIIKLQSLALNVITKIKFLK